jgi:CRISPR-associated protein Csm3
MGDQRLKDKIVIRLEATLQTGMHIGDGDAISTIGAVDSAVIKDPLTNRTMIPGSSLKGKMRSLLDRARIDEKAGNEIINRLFGSKDLKAYARLQFPDALLNDESANELLSKKMDMEFTEVKYENTINRITGTAEHPRQIERAVRGSRFDIEIVYTLEDEAELNDDFKTLAKGLRLLELDYIGGSGTRGYGRVRFALKSIEPQGINGETTIDSESLKKLFEE